MSVATTPSTTTRCLAYLLRDMTISEAERLAAVSPKLAELTGALTWRRAVPNAALRRALQGLRPPLSAFDVARDMASIPPWLVAEGTAIVLYDTGRVHDVVGVEADSTTATSVSLAAGEDDAQDGWTEEDLRRQVDEAVGAYQAVTVLALGPHAGVRLWWHRAAETATS